MSTEEKHAGGWRVERTGEQEGRARVGKGKVLLAVRLATFGHVVDKRVL